jgi:hypothetical protein
MHTSYNNMIYQKRTKKINNLLQIQNININRGILTVVQLL